MKKSLKKYILNLFIVFISILIFSKISYGSELAITAESAILIDAETGQVLYEKNAHRQMFPASTTKIMTLILGIENSDLKDRVVVDKNTPFEVEGSHIALETGEILTMNQLLDALALESANDAAMVIAKNISGSIPEFSNLMNEKAKEIGALNTNFVNPNGLPSEDHVTTAYDLSLMAKYGLENENFRNFVTKRSSKIPPTNVKSEERILNTSNKMLYSSKLINVDGKRVPIKYEGVSGIKTGYTVVAQHCLVASAKRDGREYISVVLKSDSNNMYSDTHKLLNHAFEDFDKQIISSDSLDLDKIDLDGKELHISPNDDIPINIPKNSSFQLDESVNLYEDLKLPIEKGDIIGEMEYLYQDKVVGTTSLIASSSISSISSFSLMKILLFSVLSIFFLLILRIVYIARRRKLNRAKKRRASRDRRIRNLDRI